MFKFIKELLIDPIKEGIAEAKEELAAEAQEEELKQAKIAEEIAFTDHNEKLALSFAAPFRAVALEEYVSLFSYDEEDGEEKKLVLKLYKLGVLEEKETSALAKLLERDFEIKERADVPIALFAFNAAFSGKRPEDLDKAVDIEDFIDEFNYIEDKAHKALSLSVCSYIITSSIDIGYYQKEELLPVFDTFLEKAGCSFANWQDFGLMFLLGDQTSGLNNFIGHKILKNVVDRLSKDPGSPWQNVLIK